MRLNRTSEWKVMTIWISEGHPIFNFVRLDILCLQIGHLFEKIGPFEFFESFRCSISSVTMYYAAESAICVKGYDHLNCSRGSVVQFRTSRYIKSLNRTFVWIVMTIKNSWEHPLFSCKRLDILCPRIVHSSEKLRHLNFSKGSVVEFRASWYIMRPNRTSV